MSCNVWARSVQVLSFSSCWKEEKSHSIIYSTPIINWKKTRFPLYWGKVPTIRKLSCIEKNNINGHFHSRSPAWYLDCLCYVPMLSTSLMLLRMLSVHTCMWFPVICTVLSFVHIVNIESINRFEIPLP